MVYKVNDSIISIQVEAMQPIYTNIVFWSHDRGTAKLRFKLIKGNTPLILAEGTTVPIRLMFKSTTAEGGYGKHDYLATVEDRLNGIVSIVLEDNILGYQGRVDGSIYIDFPNNQSLDTAGRFTFYIKRSPIDDSTPELEDYYFNGFSQVIDKVEKIVLQTKAEINQAVDDVAKKINDTDVSLENLNQEVKNLEGKINEGEQYFVTKSSIEKGLMIYKEQYITTENWDDIQESGIYYCAGATGENMPISGTLYGYLIVIKSASVIVQLFISNGNFYNRVMSGSPLTWFNWNKLSNDSTVVHNSGNESIDGFKDFQQTPTVNSVPVALDQFVSKTVKTMNTTDFTNESSVRFERWGRLVVANFEITNKSANFAGWENLMPFPKGYTPTSLKDWGGTLANKTNRNPALSVYANASGIAVMVSTTNLPENQECSGTVSYFTNDAWPN
ncbi:phage baseplate upper protein [Enterococcus hirae]|nr:phage baseplate upper protein [Enterococcus hirae]